MGNKERGFTVLELLLVLTLLAGAGFTLLLKIPNRLESQRLEFAATQLLEEVRDSQQAALAENSWYEVSFYTGGDAQHYQVSGQNKRVADIYLQSGIRFLNQPANLQFNAMGYSTGTTITLGNRLGERRSVIVAPVGMRIREE